MTVQELIDELESYPRDSEVHFSYNYGDHWRTQVAPKVERVESGFVEHSSYHDMDKLADEEDDVDDETKYRSVVVIS
jgi:hypothetical protein